MKRLKYVRFFDELTIKDVPKVGGKNASLGEMYQKLLKKGVKVPNGFATTSEAYNYFLEKSGTKKKIKKILKGLNTHNVVDLMKRGAKVRRAILEAEFPEDLAEEIRYAYRILSLM